MSCLDCELTQDQLRRLDGSPSAEKPLEYAIELAKKTSNYLLMINVTGPPCRNLGRLFIYRFFAINAKKKNIINFLGITIVAAIYSKEALQNT
jgi:hypothetical protein